MQHPEPAKNTPPTSLLQKKAGEGWQYVGTEVLRGLRPSISGSPSELPVQTEVELKRKYSKEGLEIQFILSSDEVTFPSDEMFKMGPDIEDKLCYVFVRNKK